MSNRRPHSGHSPVSPKPPRSYTQRTHARPDAACTARLIPAVQRREYQIDPNVVVTMASGIPGRAQSGEIEGATRLSRKGAATAPRVVHMNTPAINSSYRRKAGGSGAGGSVGVEATTRWYRGCSALPAIGQRGPRTRVITRETAKGTKLEHQKTDGHMMLG